MSPLSVNQETDFAQKAGGASVPLAEAYGRNDFRRSMVILFSSSTRAAYFIILWRNSRNELFLSGNNKSLFGTVTKTTVAISTPRLTTYFQILVKVKVNGGVPIQITYVTPQVL